MGFDISPSKRTGVIFWCRVVSLCTRTSDGIPRRVPGCERTIEPANPDAGYIGTCFLAYLPHFSWRQTSAPRLAHWRQYCIRSLWFDGRSALGHNYNVGNMVDFMVRRLLDSKAFSRSGIADFVLQRVTAMYLTIYTFIILGFFLTAGGLDHETFQAFFGNLLIKILSSLALLATLGHAWVGIWTIMTDYMRPHHFGVERALDFLRPYVLVFFIAAMLAYLVWGLTLIW